MILNTLMDEKNKQRGGEVSFRSVASMTITGLHRLLGAQCIKRLGVRVFIESCTTQSRIIAERAPGVTVINPSWGSRLRSENMN